MGRVAEAGGIIKSKSLTQWIKEHRAEIDGYIDEAIGPRSRNDAERRLWILNDEGLYNWARSEGVAI